MAEMPDLRARADCNVIINIAAFMDIVVGHLLIAPLALGCLRVERYQQALQEIDSALALIETADLLAFKGAIYFGMGQVEEAAKAFTRAFSLDKELPVPRVQGLLGWLTDNNLMP